MFVHFNWFSGHPEAYEKLPTPLKSFHKYFVRKKINKFHSEILSTWSFLTFWNGLPGIGRQLRIKMWFWHFSTHKIYVTVHGQFSEPHFVDLFFSNPGETVPKHEKTSWTQDLRMKHNQFFKRALWQFLNLPKDSKNAKKKYWFRTGSDTFLTVYYWFGKSALPWPFM